MKFYSRLKLPAMFRPNRRMYWKKKEKKNRKNAKYMSIIRRTLMLQASCERESERDRRSECMCAAEEIEIGGKDNAKQLSFRGFQSKNTHSAPKISTQ